MILDKNGTGNKGTGNNGTNGKVGTNGTLMLNFLKPTNPNLKSQTQPLILKPKPSIQNPQLPTPNPNIENVLFYLLFCLCHFYCAIFTIHHIIQ